jgi:type VI secretion system protein ImpH
MATPVGRTDSSVAEILLECPWDFDFFQAVRLLALIYPNRRLLSGFRQPPEEIVRFHAHLSMAFPPSAIRRIEPSLREDGPLVMTVNFMGLTGPAGILPAHYTEYLIARSYSGDDAAAAFFDLFNHRLISLFYLAWEKHHFPVAYQRESQSLVTERRFTAYLFDLIGMGTPGLQERLELTDSALLAYCGLIAQRPHSAVTLAGLLCDYFRLPIEIDQFVGKWCQLEDDELSYLNANASSSELGSGAIAGDKVWNPQARFRIRVGPLTLERFNRFLPDGSAFRDLVALTRYFANQTMDFEVQLILLAGEVPGCKVSGDPQSPRLGLSSWLKTVAFPGNAADLVLTVRSSAAV